MSATRDHILANIRQALRNGEPLPRAPKPSENSPRRASRHTRPEIHQALLDRFCEKLELSAGSISRLAKLDAAPDAVLDYLEFHCRPKHVKVAPAFKTLFWPKELNVEYGRTFGDDLVSVTPCFAAVAETGSVVLLSGSESPTSLNFLPDDHIVIVHIEQLMRNIEDVWSRLRNNPGGMPRTVNFISGPSRTADIEQTIQLGAHGPRRLHVMPIGHSTAVKGQSA